MRRTWIVAALVLAALASATAYLGGEATLEERTRGADGGVTQVVREAFIVSLGINSYRYPAFWRSLYRWLSPRFDLVICQSQYMLNDFRQVGRTDC